MPWQYPLAPSSGGGGLPTGWTESGNPATVDMHGGGITDGDGALAIDVATGWSGWTALGPTTVPTGTYTQLPIDVNQWGDASLLDITTPAHPKIAGGDGVYAVAAWIGSASGAPTIADAYIELQILSLDTLTVFTDLGQDFRLDSSPVPGGAASGSLSGIPTYLENGGEVILAAQHNAVGDVQFKVLALWVSKLGSA